MTSGELLDFSEPQYADNNKWLTGRLLKGLNKSPNINRSAAPGIERVPPLQGQGQPLPSLTKGVLIGPLGEG